MHHYIWLWRKAYNAKPWFGNDAAITTLQGWQRTYNTWYRLLELLAPPTSPSFLYINHFECKLIQQSLHSISQPFWTHLQKVVKFIVCNLLVCLNVYCFYCFFLLVFRLVNESNYRSKREKGSHHVSDPLSFSLIT